MPVGQLSVHSLLAVNILVPEQLMQSDEDGPSHVAQSAWQLAQ